MELKQLEKYISLLQNKEYEKLEEIFTKWAEKMILKKAHKEIIKKHKEPKREKADRKASELEILRVSEIAEEYRKKLIINQTESEKKFKAFFKSIELKYDFQRIFYHKDKNNDIKFFIADFYLPHYNVIIEIDGGYHTTKEQNRKDKTRTLVLESLHKITKVIRFDNNDINDIQMCKDKLKRDLPKKVKEIYIVDEQ